jgi:proteic killer suppression protein
MRGIFHRHSLTLTPLMIVDIIDISGLTVRKTKNQTPIGPNRNSEVRDLFEFAPKPDRLPQILCIHIHFSIGIINLTACHAIYLDAVRTTSYTQIVIRSFRSKDAELIFDGRYSRRFNQLAQIIERRLIQIHAARTLSDLAIFPGNRLEALKGGRTGQHSIRINDQYRICFVWRGGDAFEVEITEYH